MCIITSPRLPRSRRPRAQAPKHLKIDLDAALDASSSFFEETSLSLDQTNHRSTTMCFDEEIVAEHAPQHLQQETKKSVHFFERVIVRPVLHVDEFSDEEWQKCWYLPTDKQRRKDEIRATLRQLQEGKFGGCARGLEKMTDNGKTKERRNVAIREVLEEQEAQRANAKAKGQKKMVYDDMKFRMAYRPHSRAARQVAQAMGKIDEMALTSKKLRQRSLSPGPLRSRRNRSATATAPRSLSPGPLKRMRRKRNNNNNVTASIHANENGTFLQLDFARH